MPQLLQASRHVHFRHTCLVWTTSDTVCTFWHVLPLIGPFHWENSKKDKTWQKPIQFGMVPWIQGHEKMGSFTGCREMSCSQTDPSDLFEHSSLNMIFLWKYQDSPQLSESSGHAHVRHRCLARMTSDTVCMLRHVLSLIVIFFRKWTTCQKPKQLFMMPWIGHTRPLKKLK